MVDRWGSNMIEGVVIAVVRIINISLSSWAWWYYRVLVLESLFRECFQWYVIDDVSPR